MARMTNTSFMTGVKNWVLGKIANIMALIPNQASSSNQLADKNFVNSSIATATATFRGTYNVVSDLSLSYNATHAQIEAALAMKMAELSIVADNNDYAFVQIPTTDATPTQIAKIEKYKYNCTAWAFEYELNNSGFTAAQWAAINSGATLELIGKLSALPTNSELTTILNGKASKAENATAGHLASLDANGNPTDSGISLEDNGAYDVTAHNSGAKFADLSALLSNVNLNTLIPVAVRKGGMSIKFVQSSDNKYVQYRLMLSTFTTDVTKWAINDVGVYVENPEYMEVKLDAENKIIAYRKADGTWVECVGIEAPNINFDDYVEKEEGKSLIDSEFAASQSVVESPEYMQAFLDSENKIISHRDKSGVLHENVGLETPVVRTNSLSLTEAGMNELQEELRDAGFGSWSVDVDKLYPEYKYKVIFESLKKKSKLRADEGGQGKQDTEIQPFILLHFSDIHGQAAILSRILEFRELYSAYITDTIHTGDTVRSFFENDFSFWSDESDADGILQVIGNHDVWTDGEHGIGPVMTAYSEEATYKRYFVGYENDDWQDESKLMSDNPISRDWNAELTYGKCYYYKDYSSSKIRLIVIDTCHNSSTQDAWVEATLNDILTNNPDYHVIIAGHHFPKYKALQTPFNTLNPVIDSYSRDSMISAVDRFITNGGHFVCWLCGHSHRDQFGYAIDNNNIEYPNQAVICVNTCKVDITDAWTDTIRIDNTISQDCFNLFKVDTHEGFLTMYRVGAQYDQHLQKKDVIIYDYINSQIIYQH